MDGKSLGAQKSGHPMIVYRWMDDLGRRIYQRARREIGAAAVLVFIPGGITVIRPPIHRAADGHCAALTFIAGANAIGGVGALCGSDAGNRTLDGNASTAIAGIFTAYIPRTDTSSIVTARGYNSSLADKNSAALDLTIGIS